MTLPELKTLAATNPGLRAELVAKGVLVTGKPQKAHHKLGYRSGWEMQYAAHLEVLKAAGDIMAYRYEHVRLRIASGHRKAWFTPDFTVWGLDWRIEYHEVKGHMREAAHIRLKVAAGMYPHEVFVLVRKEGQQWSHEVYR